MNTLEKTYPRYNALDAIRGIAIALMLIYHFCFGLAQLGYLQANFSTSIFWITFRSVIILLFLNLVGIGLFLSRRNSAFNRNYLYRLGLLALYASLISLFSWWVRPSYFVYFGILHLIFVSSLLGLIFIRLKWVNLILGSVCLLVGFKFSIASSDSVLLSLLGITSEFRYSDDFAPLIPWFGFVLTGLFLGSKLAESKDSHVIKTWESNSWVTKLLCWTGKYSIHIYFIHFQLFYFLVLVFN
ncbi:MAG: DUF1624 domain-containing protein [Kangiellaceae bacterium]|nr:DUF1624 domain-containing protein [Kangiellaceae bacterium]